MFARLIGSAVIAGEKIDQPLAISPFQAYIQRYFPRFCAEVVDQHNGVVSPFVSDRKNFGFRSEHGEITPADFRNLFAHANNALHPVQQRIRISPLVCDIYVLKTIRRPR